MDLSWSAVTNVARTLLYAFTKYVSTGITVLIVFYVLTLLTCISYRTPVLCQGPHLRTWLGSGTYCSSPLTTSPWSLTSCSRSRTTAGGPLTAQRRRCINTSKFKYEYIVFSSLCTFYGQNEFSQINSLILFWDNEVGCNVQSSNTILIVLGKALQFLTLP